MLNVLNSKVPGGLMKYYLKYILQKLIALLLLPFHLFPVKKNRVLFLSLEGGSFYE